MISIFSTQALRQLPWVYRTSLPIDGAYASSSMTLKTCCCVFKAGFSSSCWSCYKTIHASFTAVCVVSLCLCFSSEQPDLCLVGQQEITQFLIIHIIFRSSSVCDSGQLLLIVSPFFFFSITVLIVWFFKSKLNRMPRESTCSSFKLLCGTEIRQPCGF